MFILERLLFHPHGCGRRGGLLSNQKSYFNSSLFVPTILIFSKTMRNLEITKKASTGIAEREKEVEQVAGVEVNLTLAVSNKSVSAPAQSYSFLWSFDYCQSKGKLKVDSYLMLSEGRRLWKVSASWQNKLKSYQNYFKQMKFSDAFTFRDDGSRLVYISKCVFNLNVLKRSLCSPHSSLF